MKNSNTTTLRSVWIGLGFVSTFLVSSRSEPAADRPSIELPIARVMVYEDRALVERSGTVAVGAGISQVRITKLPVGLVEPSLRASLPEGGGAKILSVSSRTEEQLETQDERLRRLEKDKSDLEGNLRQLEAKSQVLRHERYQLEEIQNVVLRSLCQRATLGTVTMEQISSASDLLAKRRSAMNAALREISVQQRKLNDQRGDIQKNINKIATPNRKTIRYADVVIESPAGGDLTLTVNYLIANASWRPRYEARLNKGKLTVQYMGEVRQGTGEPWDNVELVLSTARPSLGAQRPELGYLRIDLEKVNVGTDLVSGVGAYAGAMGRPVETDAETPAGGGDVQVKESGTSVVFQLKGRYSVPSDRRAYKLPITEFEDASPKLTFETTPKLLTYVYLKCESSNKTSFPLLPGQVDIFRESGFMGTSSLAFVSPGRSLELSFGIDEDLKVKRKFVVYTGEDRFSLGHETTVLSLAQFIKALRKDSG
ncbi:MAG: mucoidy inhibitor MuiA family protein [Planctomycetota bacterium]|nr:mucoidy inhibitor MuiA family protein [Planctomycetota bacterium]